MQRLANLYFGWIEDHSFFTRLGVLMIFIVIVVVADLVFYKQKATRWKSYLALLGFALIGGVFGYLNDQITSRISPEYFIFGKGLEDGESFTRGVAELGFSAGMIAGLFLGSSILVILKGQLKNPWSALRYSKFPLFCAICGAVLLGLIFFGIYHFYKFRDLEVLMPDDAQNRFILVSGIHWGIYIGGLIGTAWTIFRIWSRKRKMIVTSLSRN